MLKTIKDYFFLLHYVAKYTSFVWWSVIDGLIWGIYRSFTTVVFIKYIFDKIQNNRPFSEILLVISVMGAYMLLIYIFHECYYNYIEPKARQQLHERMHSELFRKAISLDLSCYDNPDFYNEFIWMLNEADNKAMEVAFDISKFINRIFSSLVIIGLIATIDLNVVLAIVFAVVVSVVLKYIRTKLLFKKEADLKPYERKSDYIGRVFYLSDYAEEIRMSKVEDTLTNEFDDAINHQIEINKQYGKKLFYTGVIRDFSTSILINIGIITLLVFKIMVQQSISLGDFAASISGTWTLFWQLNNLLDYFTKLKGHSLYAERLQRFLNYQAEVTDTKDSVDVAPFYQLSLRNVSFRYPSTDRDVLHNINIDIKKNEKIAFVGYNGAGKSTLIKLILRLYEPIEGRIEWNEQNIKTYKTESYRQKFGTVFQDFQVFAVTIAENVKTDIVSQVDYDNIHLALQKSGFSDRLRTLNKDIETELTKEFDKEGVNLSGGELQKLAIARAFIKNSDIIILDEPSSALDPMSEYELNQTMMSAAFDKTVIFISHRLSTTIMADKIYMFDNGYIIEQGNHDELMSLKGKYAEMFTMQAEKYRNEEDINATNVKY